MKILVHLVSGQNLPNYIASKIVKPEKELFIYTEDSKKQLDILNQVLINNLNPVLIPAWDFEQIKFKIDEILLRHSEDEVILNFTAGNKIMSQAAFKVFEQNKKDCIYINSQDDEFIYFNNSTNMNKVNRGKISVTARLEDYIKLNGQSITFENNSLTEQQQKLVTFLENNFPRYSGKILGFASKYRRNQNFNFSVSDGKLKGTTISYQNKNTELKFFLNDKEIFSAQENGQELLDLCFGKWFEHLCFNQIKTLKYFDDLKLNCHILKASHKDGDDFVDKNELDILAIKGIYPSIFECKSGGVKSEHVDKLVSLKQTYLGRYSSIFFITFFPLNDSDEFNILLKEKMLDNKIIHLSYKQIKSKIITELRKKENLK